MLVCDIYVCDEVVVGWLVCVLVWFWLIEFFYYVVCSEVC